LCVGAIRICDSGGAATMIVLLALQGNYGAGDGIRTHDSLLGRTKKPVSRCSEFYHFTPS